MLTGAWAATGGALDAAFLVHSLHDNNIGDDGARALATALPQCTALQRLG